MFCLYRMPGDDEQTELLAPDDCGCHATAASSRPSTHHDLNLVDFDAKYGRKADAAKSWRDSLSCDVSCRRDKVLNFVERRLPVVKVIRTYKVSERPERH